MAEDSSADLSTPSEPATSTALEGSATPIADPDAPLFQPPTMEAITAGRGFEPDTRTLNLEQTRDADE